MPTEAAPLPPSPVAAPEGNDPLFGGGGEMAQLTGAFPWHDTALGPPGRWPTSLRTAVRIMLTSRFAMWMGWGRELTFFYNDAYRSMTLGAKHPWALGRPASEVWAEIWEQLDSRIRQVMGQGTATWDERLLLFLERSGYREETYHTFSYSPLSDDAGATVGLLCVVSEDTERVIGERRLALLHELATQLSGADGTPQVLSAINRCWNKDARDLPFTLTYLLEETGELSLRALTGLDAAHPAAIERVARPLGSDAVTLWPLEQALASPAARVVELDSGLSWPAGPWLEAPRQAVLVPIPRSGHARPWGVLIAGLNRFRPFDEAYQNFLGLFVGQVAAALASVHAYEDERKRAEALAALDRTKTAFFSNVSHEFRTPLTLMLGPTEDALSAGRALSGSDLDTVHRNQLRLLKLVNTLLEFSRIESGRVNAQYESVDLAQLTADLASTFRSAVERAGLAFEVEVQPIGAPTFVDPEMWEGMLFNLLSNAFKFTFYGKISVRLEPLGQSHVQLRVSDTGVGIPAHELHRVFERFHRIEGVRARTHEGSGIGLALVADLVQLHGGEIAVESESERGTSFSIRLPTGSAHLPSERLRSSGRVRPAARAAEPFVAEALRWLPASPQQRPLEEAGALAAGSTDRPHILIADDNADMREYLARLLGAQHSIETVEDGALALAAARRRRPDLVISDVMMPVLDGFGLLQQLRGDPALSAIPVLMLSARAGEDAVVEGIERGADDYLVKPFSARELLARVNTRLELERLRRRLQDERSSLVALFGQAPLPICVLQGPELVFLIANAAFRERVGGRDPIGKALLAALPELAGQGFDQRLLDVLTSGKAQVGYEVPVRLERGEGIADTFWTFILSPVAGDDGHIDRVIAIGKDVTDQVLARLRLEALAREAASANRAKDEFLAMLGHELRNPLAPMLTALQLMRMRGRTSREQEVLERQVAHLSRLVDDLLDVSRIARGKIELDRRHIELWDAVSRAMELASPVLELSHQRVELDVPKLGLVIDADVGRMAQVVANLLTNAAKYSDPHTRIQVRAERRGPSVRLSVQDHGIGIAPEMIGGVFDAFVQQPQTLDRARGGLGLGLTIVRSFVEKHGGSVRAESAGLGQGSEFIVELPAVDGPSTPLLGSDTMLGTSGPRAGRAKRILIVDDNEDAAFLLEQALQQLGYQVLVAHDGPSALDVSATFLPDVALLDIGLPVMDGYELAERLLESRGRSASLRLVALTGYGQDQDRERSRRAGFACHLVKPLDLSLIEQAIEDAAQ